MAAKKSKKAAPKKTKATPKKAVKANKAVKAKASKIKASPKPKVTPKTKTQTTTSNSLSPSRDGVLVERVVESDRTPGGLYIPVMATEKPLKGRVVSAGRGKISKRGKLRPLDVQPGDEVLFGKHAGTEIKIDGKEFLLIREDEILGVVS